MNRMFREVTRIYNPVTGCDHGCSYCYARRLAEGRLRHLPRYAGGFKPAFHPGDLRRHFRKGLIFVCNMGDLFGKWVPREQIEGVLQVIRESPGATFLLLTKNPVRYHEFELPPNAIAGATIETNSRITGRWQHCLGDHLSIWPRAPQPVNRFLALCELNHPRKFVSIEPVMDFELDGMVKWLKLIAPEFVYLGYDNHNHHLSEPSLAQTRELIRRLGEFTEVRVKTLRKAWAEGGHG